MKLIPVIDLKGGLVVAARLGDRGTYAPIRSPLCSSAAPQAVVAALLELHPFTTVYIADLDAIGGGPGHLAILDDLQRRHPGLALWIDNGLSDLARVTGFARPVIGSESLADLGHFTALRATLTDPILSLDYRGDQPLGPPGLHDRPDLWPLEVILMTLSRVGSGAGPDLARLAGLRRSAPALRVYAAGGVRGPGDLNRLRDLGIAGALVSTALHQGQLTAQFLGDLDASEN